MNPIVRIIDMISIIFLLSGIALFGHALAKICGVA